MTSENFYHLALLVDDLDEAKSRLSQLVGLTWCESASIPTCMRTPAGLIESAPLFTFSRQGPPYIELIHRGAKPWDGPAGIHHAGFWSDDVADDVAAMTASGASFEAAGGMSADRLDMYGFVRAPDGMLVEFVTTDRKVGLQRWTAGVK